MESLRQAVQDEVDAFDPELPERPEAEVEPVNEDDWLFDGQRDYLTQLAIYKARKNGPEQTAAD
jgi:hypothetical protein